MRSIAVSTLAQIAHIAFLAFSWVHDFTAAVKALCHLLKCQNAPLWWVFITVKMPEMLRTRLTLPVTFTEESPAQYIFNHHTFSPPRLSSLHSIALSLHLKGQTKQPDVLDALFPFSMVGQPEKYCSGINSFPCDIFFRRE